MKILMWNVYNGFQTGLKQGLLPSTERRQKALRWVHEQDADMVCLMELQDFHEADFAQLFRRWGHKNGQFLKGTYPMGVSSHIAIGNPIRHNIDMTHGLIAVEQGPLTILLTHIPPGKYATRAVELRSLLATVLSVLKQKRPLILLGDINGGIDCPLAVALTAIGLRPLLPLSERDQVFVSQELLENTQATIEWSEELEALSDHLPVQIEIR